MSWWWFLIPATIFLGAAAIHFGWKKMLPVMYFLIAVGIIASLWWGVPAIISRWKSDGGKGKETHTEQTTTIHEHEPVEALVLEKECLTPCEVKIAWKFRIQSEGLPIKVTFKGVKEPVSYPGEGDFRAPKEMRSGETLIESAVPGRTTIPIKVYRRVYIRR